MLRNHILDEKTGDEKLSLYGNFFRYHNYKVLPIENWFINKTNYEGKYFVGGVVESSNI
jgi:hypothetical protein